MHHYSTDTGRWKIMAALGAIAILLTLGVNSILEQYLPPWVLETGVSLTVLTLASILYFFYRKFLWLPMGRLSDSQVPIFQGNWELTEDSAGILTDDMEGGEFRNLAIEQDWEKIQVDYYDKNRIYLRSDSAKITTFEAKNPEIVVTCTGQVPDKSGKNYENIDVTFRLRFLRQSGEDRLVGHYYGNLIDGDSGRVEFRLRSRQLIRWRPELEQPVE